METTEKVIEIKNDEKETMETKFELRTLTAVDVAPMTRIMSRIGFVRIKEAFANIDFTAIVKDGKKMDLESIGLGIAIDLVGVILENYAAVQDLLIDWLASLTGKKKKEIEALELADFTELLICVVQKEEFKDFFKVVSKFLK